MKRKGKHSRAVVLLVVLVLSMLPAGCLEEARNGDGLATGRPGDSERIVRADRAQERSDYVELKPVPGPRHAIAVAEFDVIGPCREASGDWDIGRGFRTMLTRALDQTGRFYVVERAHLGQILTEQQLTGQGLTRANTGAALGQLTGARFLAFGSITEFGARESGGGLSFGIAGLGSKNLGGAISPSTSKGSVAVDLRVVDTTTGRVVCSETIRKQIKSTALNLSLNVKKMSFGGNQFNQTPLGKATRQAIVDAVHTIAQGAGATRWTGCVVDADQGKVFVNAGTNVGMRIGDQLDVQRVTKKLTDPETGELLSTVKETLGSVTVEQTEDKVSICSYLAVNAGLPQRGDLVVFKVQ